MDPPKPFEFNEYVTRSLYEWSDPKIRLEKKRIRRQIVNQNSREWLRDIRHLSPLEIDMLAENYSDALEWKRDHSRMVRRAIFDEYTFKKLPTKKKTKCCKNDVTNGNELEKSVKEFSSATLAQREFFENEITNIVDFQNTREAAESSQRLLDRFTRSDGTFDCENFIENMVRFTLRRMLQDKITLAVRLLKQSVLRQAILPNATDIVDYFVQKTNSKVNDTLESLNDLSIKGPEELADSLINQIIEESPNYIENEVTNRFIEPLIEPITKCLVNKYTNEVKFSFDISNIEYIKLFVDEQVDTNWWASTVEKHVCTSFKIAEDVAEEIARTIFNNVTFGLDVPKEESESSEGESRLQEKYKEHIAAIEAQALKIAKMNISHLKDPETVRRDINKKHTADGKRYTGSAHNCKCAGTTLLGGKKKPFSIPPYKLKHNLIFYKNVSGSNEEPLTTLYPTTKPNVKLLCDPWWKCFAVPLERELRDTPYRSSYPPQSIVDEIKNTKRIKPSDRDLIEDIGEKMRKKRNVDDIPTIAKKIINESLANLFESVSMSKVDESRQTLSEKASKYTISRTSTTDRFIRVEEINDPSLPDVPTNTDQNKRKTLTRPETRSANAVPKALEPVPYHKYVLQGYNYNMIPITPCRFHDMKDLKTVLKRFETAGGSAAVEFHFEGENPPVNVDELLPIDQFIDTYDDWVKNEEQVTSLWTKSLNDTRLKRMAKFRKLFRKDPVYGFAGQWDKKVYKCPT